MHALGERIIVTGRVLDSDAVNGWLVDFLVGRPAPR